MGFGPEFLEELRSRLPVSDVVGKRVKLIRKGREFSGLCPFHNEKTPSFTVNDDKGFYHCFGCGAHGDVISFVTETEGLSFPEAVERLAGQAGLQMPEFRPEDREKAEIRKNLYDVMETAASWYQSQLKTTVGREGLSYLKRRGLSDQTVSHFRLGYAPNNRTGLKEAMLAREGITEQMLVDAGLLIRPEEGDNRETYDRFRHRVMFPITDRQGRIVAFGGRALASDAKAKYLNSPETTLFHKGHLLYNMAGARRAAYDHNRLVVAEGYMDVIALHQYDFPYAVAPLGTAVTEDQITAMWRMTPEPIMCFDGDKAGIRAAHRVVDRALPMLKAGHSLKFVHLPAGEDPDSLVQGQGAGAFEKLLQDGQSLSALLWQMMTDEVSIDTPEQRAGLQDVIRKKLLEISDETIRGYYESDFAKRFKNLLGDDFMPDAEVNFHDKPRQQSSYSQQNQPYRGGGKSPGWSKKSRKTGLAGQKSLSSTTLFQRPENPLLSAERLIILTLLNHPWLLERHHEELATFDFESVELDKLLKEIISLSDCESYLEQKRLTAHLKNNGFGKALEVIFDQVVHKADWFAWPSAAEQDVEQGWAHMINRHRLAVLEKERAAVENELAQNMTDEVFARFQALTKEVEDLKVDLASSEGYGIASGRKKPS